MKLIKRPIASLAKTASRRLPGYLQECLRRGQMSADGRSLTFTERDFREIRRQYNPRHAAAFITPGCCG